MFVENIFIPFLYEENNDFQAILSNSTLFIKKIVSKIYFPSLIPLTWIHDES